MIFRSVFVSLPPGQESPSSRVIAVIAVIGKAKPYRGSTQMNADQEELFTMEARREQELGFNFDLALCRFCLPPCSFVSFVVKGFGFSISAIFSNLGSSGNLFSSVVRVWLFR
jgi:hypothetical protein